MRSNKRSGWPFYLLLLLATVGCRDSGKTASAKPVMFRGNAQHLAVYQTTAVHRTPQAKWKFETKGLVRSSPTVSGNQVFVGSGDGNLYSIDRRGGEEVWRFKTGGAVHSSPAVANGVVYFTSRDRGIYAVERQNGKQKWRVQTGPLLPHKFGWDYYLSSPTVDGPCVYVGSGDGNLYALQAETGTVIWKLKTHGRVRSSPAVWGDNVYAGSMDGHLYAVDKSDGTVKWKFATDGASLDSERFGFDRTAVVSSPSVDDLSIFVGGRDGYLYSVDRRSGKENWRFNYDVSWVVASPVAFEEVILSGCSDRNYVNALDRATGEERWRFTARGAAWSSPAIADGVLYFGSFDGNLYGLDSSTGAEKWRFRADDKILSSPMVADGVVYFGSDDGYVYAVTGASSPDSNRVRPKKAVYWQESKGPKYFKGDVQVRDYFVSAGYEQLSEETLSPFVKEQIADQTPSVIVFATDRIPPALVSATPERGLFREYLEAGGKVVWLGLPPNLATWDPRSGKFTGVDATIPERLVGVKQRRGDNWDEYGARATTAGLEWGLPEWSISSHQVDTTEVSIVLALDEYGRAGAWVKSYGGPKGTGFVHLWGRSRAPKDLTNVQAVAEYGLK